MLLPVALVAEGLPQELSSLNLAGFAFLSIVGALLAYVVWFRGIERLPALAVSFLGVPKSSGGHLPRIRVPRGSRSLPLQLAGAVLVLASVLFAQRSPPTL